MLTLFSNKYYLIKNYKIILLLAIILLAFYRSPYIFLNGRFVAEEGSFFFKNAYLYGPIYGLSQILFGNGYFNLWANVSSVFAAFLPLKYAPFATVYMAFFVQFYLFVFIIYSENTFLIKNIDKFLVSLIILVVHLKYNQLNFSYVDNTLHTRSC